MEGEKTMRNYSYMTVSEAVKVKISQVLRALGVFYEVSGCGDCYYFSIAAEPMQAEKINAYIDELQAEAVR